MKKCAKLRGSGRGWSAKKKEGWGIKGQAEGGLRKMCKIKRVRRRVECEKMCEIKRVGALRGRCRVDCEKMCEIKRVRRRVECEKKEGCCIKGQAEGGLRKNVRN